MLPATSIKSSQKRVRSNTRVRFPNIVEDAAMLDVERTHLYRVLTGARPSKSLLARYRQLKGAAK